MKPAINCFFVILVILILSQSSQAIIVWNGEIVEAWPQEVHQVVLGKRAASPSGSEPYGFFPRPRDTTYGVVMIVDFSDQEAKFTKEQVEEWLNKTGTHRRMPKDRYTIIIIRYQTENSVCSMMFSVITGRNNPNRTMKTHRDMKKPVSL
jgi:hypothetical protein